MEDFVDNRLTRVSDIFDKVVQDDSPNGVAFTVRQNGKVLFSRTSGIKHDALLPIFSGTKGLMAGTIAVLVERGLVNYADPLHKYWKEAIPWPDLTVEMALSHRSGLPHTEGLTDSDNTWDSDAMLLKLAQTKQLVPSGGRMAYQWLTLGWFAHAIIKSVTGKSAGAAFRDLIGDPYQIDAFVGVPVSEQNRIAHTKKAADYRTNVFLKPDNKFAPIVYGGGYTLNKPVDPWNDPENYGKELPGGGGKSNADAMAKFYDTLLDVKNGPLSTESLRAAWTPRFEDIDYATDRPIVMAMGFEREDSINSYGPVVPAFGHTGAGGSIHGCWPEQGISFSFLPQTMRTDQEDQRGKSLLAEVAKALI
jgi:CubicO group peptidase (beta-lactamase class C family)